MDDKTLLERAARAAGYASFDWLSADHWMNVYTHEGRQSAWNPITDDGDALRLAVKLRINIEHGQYSVRAWTDDAAPVMVDETVFTPDESQRQFAIREAITRAAAAIGSAHEAQ